MGKVIVNGIDVSECEFYEPKAEVMTCHEESITKRCNITNCYYKQLQKLKHQYADVLKLAKENADSNEFCLQELEKENKHLKKCCTQAGEELEKHSFKWDGKEKNLVVQAMELNERFSKLEKENEQYKQTLQEIREIVSEPCIVDENCQTCNSGCMQKDILAKINEVIGAEE